ncbi:MAG: PAS domain-containing protein [Campylobacterales bacterium]|nr:PAS domain-containing protein [Campylobacterales bacterium]
MAGKEVFFEDDYILSETDEKGYILYASDSFCKIAKYTKEELLGKPHNIVRHPDMPRVAFKMLWDAITTKGFWRGIVKNRTKDGNYYWVDAVVLRRVVNGKIIYCSIRTKPKRQDVEEAEKLYATLE